MKKWIGKLAYLFLATVVATAAYVSLRETPVLVDVATISNGPMQVTINEEGVTRVKEIYKVFPPIAGHLERITLEEGDPVKSFETVIGYIHPIDPPFLDQRTQTELTAAIEAAKSAVKLAEVDLSRGQADLKLAELEYQRALELQRNDFVSKATLDKKLNDVELQRAQIATAKATIDLRKAELESARARQTQPTAIRSRNSDDDCCIKIMAPVDGTILKIINESEQVVSPSMTIVEIGNPSDLEITVDLLSSDAVNIKPGSSVIISEWGGEENLLATVRRIDPAGFTKVSALGIEEQRVNAVLDFEEVPADLGHGYRVFANFIVWSTDNTLQVPIGALFRSEGNWAVFAVEDDHAVLKVVRLGRMNDTHAQVLEGLEANEHVVLYPNDQLEDGGLVERR